VTKYTLHGKNVVHMTRGSDELHFFYDAQNKPAVVVFNGTAYAYLYNQQDDVIGLLDSNGTHMVSYTYDAWGKPISKQLEGFMEGRGSMVATAADEDFVQITLDDSREHGNEVVSTILCEGDAVGAVVLYGRDEKNKFGDTEQKLAMTAATFLGRQMEQ